MNNATRALQRAEARDESAAVMPPKMYGAPTDPDAVDAIAAAFEQLFGRAYETDLSEVLEDAAELGQYVEEARDRNPTVRSHTRVTALRFVAPDRAEMRFAIQLGEGDFGP